MSYIQILLASSVIAGLAVVGLKMMEDQEKLARVTSQRFEIDYLINEMRHILKDPVNCRASFKGFNPEKSVRRISSLKKELQGGRFKEATYFLKYSTYNSSKRNYGQDNIRIHSYEISDQSEDVDVKKGSTNLVVTLETDFEEKEGSKKLVRRIPLRFTLKNERIETCELFDNQGKSTSGYSNLGNGLHLGGERREATLSVQGGLSLLPYTGDFPECNKKTFGTLLFMKKYDDLFFCNEFSSWTSLGALPKAKLSSSYKIFAGATLEKSETTKRHRVCIIQEINSNVQGSCTLEPLETTYFKNYKIVMKFQSPQGGQFCRVECFN